MTTFVTPARRLPGRSATEITARNTPRKARANDFIPFLLCFSCNLVRTVACHEGNPSLDFPHTYARCPLVSTDLQAALGSEKGQTRDRRRCRYSACFPIWRRLRQSRRQ